MTTYIKLARLPRIDIQVATALDWKVLTSQEPLPLTEKEVPEYVYEDPPGPTHSQIKSRWHIVQVGSKLVGFVENIKQ